MLFWSTESVKSVGLWGPVRPGKEVAKCRSCRPAGSLGIPRGCSGWQNWPIGRVMGPGEGRGLYWVDGANLLKFLTTQKIMAPKSVVNVENLLVFNADNLENILVDSHKGPVIIYGRGGGWQSEKWERALKKKIGSTDRVGIDTNIFPIYLETCNLYTHSIVEVIAFVLQEWASNNYRTLSSALQNLLCACWVACRNIFRKKVIWLPPPRS